METSQGYEISAFEWGDGVCEIKPLEAVNCEFSIDYHNAIRHVKDVRHKENIVIEEVKKGISIMGRYCATAWL